MATINGRECEVIGWADTGLYCITSLHGGRLAERLEWNHDVMSNFCLSFPTEAAAQVFIDQHADKPATPAAESDSGEIERLRAELAAARAERDAAVGVLAFYANADRYDYDETCCVTRHNPGHAEAGADILGDGGERARAALATAKGAGRE